MINIEGHWEAVNDLHDVSRLIREHYNSELADKADELIEDIESRIKSLEYEIDDLEWQIDDLSYSWEDD